MLKHLDTSFSKRKNVIEQSFSLFETLQTVAGQTSPLYHNQTIHWSFSLTKIKNQRMTGADLISWLIGLNELIGRMTAPSRTLIYRVKGDYSIQMLICCKHKDLFPFQK